MYHITKRGVIRIASFLTAFIITGTVLVVTSENKITNLEADITNSELRSIGDLQTYIDTIKATLLKGIYSSSHEMLNATSVKLSSETSAARYALLSISSDSELLNRIYMYLAQVSDFSSAISRKSGNGEDITEDEVNTLYSFIDYASGITEELGILLEQVKAGNFSPENADNSQNPTWADSLNSTISTIDESFSEYPTLVYDGPFSDHIMNKEPLMTKNQPEISEESARALAATYLNTSADSITQGSDSDGRMPAYNYSFENTDISISKNGGYLIYLITDAAPADIKLSAEQAEESALIFLENTGYSGLQKNYYEISNGVCYINYAYTENAVTFYPDLVKIGVSLDDGSIVSFDSRGYLVNHTERSLAAVKVSDSAARSSVPASAEIISSRLALIPVNGITERLCYEYNCKGTRDENLLIYVDAETGKEVSVLILLINENGTLSI